MRAAWAQVDLKALRNNYQEIKKQLKPKVKLCAVVKADAYGHGAVPVARIAVSAGADYLAVATLSEGIELRQAGFTTPILLLGLVTPAEAAQVAAYDITQVVCSLALAKALAEAGAAQNKTVKIHLKVDTGMGRIGVRPEEIGELAKNIKSLSHIEIEGMFSHFATADAKDKGYTKLQLAKFEQAIKAVEAQGIKLAIKHIAESAAILEIPEAHYDMVRAGVIQYGLWPSAEVTHPVKLKSVMKLMAKVVWLKKLAAGESIGYGRQFVAKRDYGKQKLLSHAHHFCVSHWRFRCRSCRPSPCPEKQHHTVHRHCFCKRQRVFRRSDKHRIQRVPRRTIPDIFQQCSYAPNRRHTKQFLQYS